MSALLLAILSGLRHATDPDHLTAVSTLVLSDQRDGVRRAARLGALWGLGHATTLLLVGAPLILLGRQLPEGVQRFAEAGVGALIVVFAVRLLLRWRRGYFHWHPHTHGDETHSHPHFHDRPTHRHSHAHDHAHRMEAGAGRSPGISYVLGLVHGVGGSAGATLLVIAAVPGPWTAVGALCLFAGGTAVSMWLAAWVFGLLITREQESRTLPRVVPVLGVASLLFGLWYGGMALAV